MDGLYVLFLDENVWNGKIYVIGWVDVKGGI